MKNEKLKIRTDNKWKPLKIKEEVGKRIHKREFDWLEKEEYSFGYFRYLKSWYHLSQFEVTPADSFPGNWIGYHSFCINVGLCIEIDKTGEYYKVGSFHYTGDC